MDKAKFIPLPLKLSAVVILLTIFTYACGSSDEQAQSATASTPTVQLQTAQYSSIAGSQKFSGIVENERTVNMSTKVMGEITEFNVDAGDYARKGEVLVRIKDDNLKAQKSQIEAQLVQAKANLKNTQTNFQRIKALYEKGSATQKEFDDMQTQLQSAEANVNALNAKLQEIEDLLNYTILVAPFDGNVVRKMASEGDMASPGRPLLLFEQAGTIKVEMTVPESEITQLNRGDTVSVDVKAAGHSGLKGIVATINPAGNRGSRQFMVEVKLPDLPVNSGLKSGMFAEVSLLSGTDSLLTVPRSAIVERGQLTGLYTLNDSSEVMLRWVRLGNAHGKTVEVLSGLAPGERYVKAFEGRLQEGQKVTMQ